MLYGGGGDVDRDLAISSWPKALGGGELGGGAEHVEPFHV
jgi:hypothetical protein